MFSFLNNVFLTRDCSGWPYRLEPRSVIKLLDGNVYNEKLYN